MVRLERFELPTYGFVERNTIRYYLRIAAMHGFTDTVPDEQLAEIASAVIR